MRYIITEISLFSTSNFSFTLKESRALMQQNVEVIERNLHVLFPLFLAFKNNKNAVCGGRLSKVPAVKYQIRIERTNDGLLLLSNAQVIDQTGG